MPRNVLTDVQPATFRGLDFMAQVVEWNDTRKPRLAVHEYLKRDGAEIEYMGRAPHRVRFNVVYVGANWRKEYQRFVALVDANPKGLLIHPLFGSMNAACEGFDGATVNAESAIDTVTVPVGFVEDAVDQRIDTPQGTPAAKAQRANTYSANLAAFSGVFVKVSASLRLAQKVIGAFTAAALDVGAGKPNASSTRLYGDVMVAISAVRSALAASTAGTPAQRFEALAAAEQAAAACADLDTAISATRPVAIVYTVPARASLLSIAQAVYGRDAFARLAEIRANNPGRWRSDAAIEAGTVLDLISPPAR